MFQLSGIFVMHLIVMGFALIITLLHLFFPNFIKSGIDEISAVRKASDLAKSSVFKSSTNTEERLENKNMRSELISMKTEILEELNRNLHEEVLTSIRSEIKTSKNEMIRSLKDEIETFQWQHERSI